MAGKGWIVNEKIILKRKKRSMWKLVECYRRPLVLRILYQRPSKKRSSFAQKPL
jgi:hypothetical protein